MFKLTLDIACAPFDGMLYIFHPVGHSWYPELMGAWPLLLDSVIFPLSHTHPLCVSQEFCLQGAD